MCCYLLLNLYPLSVSVCVCVCIVTVARVFRSASTRLISCPVCKVCERPFALLSKRQTSVSNPFVIARKHAPKCAGTASLPSLREMSLQNDLWWIRQRYLIAAGIVPLPRVQTLPLGARDALPRSHFLSMLASLRASNCVLSMERHSGSYRVNSTLFLFPREGPVVGA